MARIRIGGPGQPLQQSLAGTFRRIRTDELLKQRARERRETRQQSEAAQAAQAQQTRQNQQDQIRLQLEIQDRILKRQQAGDVAALEREKLTIAGRKEAAVAAGKETRKTAVAESELERQAREEADRVAKGVVTAKAQRERDVETRKREDLAAQRIAAVEKERLDRAFDQAKLTATQVGLDKRAKAAIKAVKDNLKTTLAGKISPEELRKIRAVEVALTAWNRRMSNAVPGPDALRLFREATESLEPGNAILMAVASSDWTARE